MRARIDKGTFVRLHPDRRAVVDGVPFVVVAGENGATLVPVDVHCGECVWSHPLEPKRTTYEEMMLDVHVGIIVECPNCGSWSVLADEGPAPDDDDDDTAAGR